MFKHNLNAFGLLLFKQGNTIYIPGSSSASCISVCPSTLVATQEGFSFLQAAHQGGQGLFELPFPLWFKLFVCAFCPPNDIFCFNLPNTTSTSLWVKFILSLSEFAIIVFMQSVIINGVSLTIGNYGGVKRVGQEARSRASTFELTVIYKGKSACDKSEFASYATF